MMVLQKIDPVRSEALKDLLHFPDDAFGFSVCYRTTTRSTLRNGYSHVKFARHAIPASADPPWW